MASAHQAGINGAVVLAAEHDVRRAAQMLYCEGGPLGAVVLELIGNEVDVAIGMDFLKPGSAEFSGDGLRRVMGENDDQMVYLTAGRIDEMHKFQETIARLRDPEYGTCLGCGGVIPFLHMAEDPGRRTCPECPEKKR